MEGLTDPWEFAETIGLYKFGEVGGDGLESASGVEVGATFEGVFSLELQNGADFAKGGGYLILGHRAKLSTESCARQRKGLVAIDLPPEAGDAFESTK